MSGVKAWRTRQGSPLIVPYFVEASQDIKWGDLVVLEADAVATRVVLATTTHLQQATPNGVLGFAWHDLKLDSTGQVVQSVPSTVETGAAVVHPIPSFSRLMHRGSQALAGTTPDIGNYKIQIAVFTDDLEVLMDVCSNNGVATVTQLHQGLDFGLIKDSGDGNYKVDINVSSGAGSFAIVTEVDTTQANFNASADTNNAVWVRIDSTGQQYLTGLLH